MQNRNALAVLGRSGNPVFRGNAFAPDATFAAAPAAQRMTLGGSVNKNRNPADPVPRHRFHRVEPVLRER